MMNTDVRSTRLALRATIPSSWLRQSSRSFASCRRWPWNRTRTAPGMAQCRWANSPHPKGRLYFRNKSLDRASGDRVDTTPSRPTAATCWLRAQDQTIELKVVLEDAGGNVVGKAGPPLDPNKDRVYIEWLKTTIGAGSYYVRVESLEDDATGYYIRFGLEDALNRAPELASKDPKPGNTASPNHLLMREVVQAYKDGHSLLIFQHMPMDTPYATFIEGLAKRLLGKVDAPAVSVPRVPQTNAAFFFVPQGDVAD